MSNNQMQNNVDPSKDVSSKVGLPDDYHESEFPNQSKPDNHEVSDANLGDDHSNHNDPNNHNNNNDDDNDHNDSDKKDELNNGTQSDNVPEAQAEAVKTDSLNRWLGTPKIRFTVLASCIGIVLLGAGGMMLNKAVSSPEQEVVSGEVTVPKTRVGASAIVNNEQAAHIREQQVKAGENAEKKGETYLASIVTVGETENMELAAPTQPGLKTPIISNSQTFKDPEGRVYTADQAVELLNSGASVEGVTKGKGSIVDVNLNTSGAKARTSNAPLPAGGEASSSKNTYEPHVIQPYSPSKSGPTAIQSELLAEQATSLEKSAKDVDEWQDQYLALRLKKASMVNQKTQLAFTEQVVNIEKAVSASPEAQAARGGFTTRIYSNPTEVAEPKAQGIATESSQPIKSEFKPVIFAGESFKAILKNQVNSDTGNEVIAILQNGPLKGATLMGTIAKTNDNIQFNFTRLLRKGKSEINIVAVGRQLGNNSSGMADDIKKHYLVRYSALVASSALSGVGKSYEQTSGTNASISGNGTVVTNSTDPTNDRIIGNAVGELGNEISQEIDTLTQKPTTYITNNGKIFNVFFNQNVLETASTAGTKVN